jgi:nicotinamidase-related amidase
MVIVCEDGRGFPAPAGRTALVAIDMQRDFLEDGGFCAVAGDDVAVLRATIPKVAALSAAARRAGWTLFHTREGYAPDMSDASAMKKERQVAGRAGPLGRFLIRGEPGHDFIPELRPHAGEIVVDKPGFGAFHRTDLEAKLRALGIETLVLCGITTQCCVQSTLREAIDRGFRCLTVADACAAFEPAVHAAALTLIRAENNLFGWIATTDAVLAAVDGTAAAA